MSTIIDMRDYFRRKIELKNKGHIVSHTELFMRLVNNPNVLVDHDEHIVNDVVALLKNEQKWSKNVLQNTKKTAQKSDSKTGQNVN